MKALAAVEVQKAIFLSGTGRWRDGVARAGLVSFQYFAGAAYRALTAAKDGPSLYDVCDPLLRKPNGGDPHLSKFYRTALGNPALRPLLCRTGLPELRDEARLSRLREAIRQARDDAAPDWGEIGQPVAALLDTIALSHPKPNGVPPSGPAPKLAQIEGVIPRDCAAHRLRAFRTTRLHPGLCGVQPDRRRGPARPRAKLRWPG